MIGLLGKIQLVKDRIWLVKKLDENRKYFYDEKLLRVNEYKQGFNPYSHFSGLKIYLLLTCFDILGQKDEWKDFSSWLTSKKKDLERDQIFNRYRQLNRQEGMIKIHEDYNSIYGVKRSFMNFANEKLPEALRVKLLNSVIILKGKVSLPTILSDGRILIKGGDKAEKYIASDSEKLTMMFKARNSFTHSGLPIGNSNELFFKEHIIQQFKPDFMRGDMIFDEIKNKTKYTLVVFGWPKIVLEVLEDYIRKLELQN